MIEVFSDCDSGRKYRGKATFRVFFFDFFVLFSYSRIQDFYKYFQLSPRPNGVVSKHTQFFEQNIGMVRVFCATEIKVKQYQKYWPISVANTFLDFSLANANFQLSGF